MKMDVQNTIPEYLRGISVTKIFIAAFVTQFCMGYEVLLRLNAASTIKHNFFDAFNPLTSGAMIGEILGVLFLGFAIANFFMSPFVDVFGIKKVHFLSVIVYLLGTVTIVLAIPGSEHAYSFLWFGSLIQGLAWGSIEAALNPLVVSIYPTKKVPKLNLFHAAYALGMLIAAPTCLVVSYLDLNWQFQLSFVFIPAAIALILILQLKYPHSERVAHGISFKGMFKHTFNNILFFVFLFVMFLTSATELVPSSWIDLTLTKVVGIQGFWLVAFIYTIHIVVRLFTGVLHRILGSNGILFFGSLFAMGGLFLLSHAHSPSLAILAALLFGIGTSVMWPTMLASTSERFPYGGSLAIGVTASAGMLSTYILMPIFGQLFDKEKIRIAGGNAAFKALTENTPAYEQVMATASSAVFQISTLLPCALIIFFAIIWFLEIRSKKIKAYSQKKLTAQSEI